MNQAEVKQRTIGINFNKDGIAEVAIWAPLAENVAISLTHNKGLVKLFRDEQGYWKSVTDQIKPGDLYKII